MSSSKPAPLLVFFNLSLPLQTLASSFFCREIRTQQVFEEKVAKSNSREVDRLSKLCKDGSTYQAIEIMKQRGIPLSKDNAMFLLQDCIRRKDLECGRHLQSLMVQSELGSVAILGDHLIRLFSSCGCLLDANEAFHHVIEPTVYTWSSIISARANLGQSKSALQLYFELRQSDVKFDKFVYLAILKACTMTSALRQGREIHHHIVEDGFDSDRVLGNTLVHMYAKCGSLADSWKVFDMLLNPDVVSWCALINGCAEHGDGPLALDAYEKMQQQPGITPNKVTFLGLLKACGSVQAIEQGRLIHGMILQRGLEWDIALGNTLVDVYAKCGSMTESQKMFDYIPKRDVVSWNALIAGYVQHGETLLILDLLESMQVECIKPSKVTFVSILKVCGSEGSVQQGRLTHSQILIYGLLWDAVLGSALVDMYAKCGSLEESRNTFGKLLDRDVVSWNSLIGGYAQHNQGCLALECFEEMQEEAIAPEYVTFLSTLKACTSTRDVEQGRRIHDQILQRGFEPDIVMASTLIDMYGKCGSLQESHRLFDRLQNRNVVTWNALIAGYAHHSEGLSALDCLLKMHGESIDPDIASFLSVLKACSSLESVVWGRFIHDQILEHGFELDVAICNTLVDMYAKCGSIEESQKSFEETQKKSVVTWNALIAGCVLNNEFYSALSFLENMQVKGCKPNRVTYLSILKACGFLGTIQQGRFFHDDIVQKGFDLDVGMGIALVDMYCKCGCLDESRRLFDRLPVRDVVSWGAMIAGYAQHGEGLLAVDCFDKMQHDGIKPDKVALLCILVACSRAGLIEKGRWYFEHMEKEFGVVPDEDHYICMVDILGRAGCLKEAEELLNTAKEPNILGWKLLLSACRMHGNVDLGRQCFEKLVCLDFHCASGYVLMSNIYANAEMQGGANKTAKCSSKAFLFGSESRTDIENWEVDAMLQRLNRQLGGEGCIAGIHVAS